MNRLSRLPLLLKPITKHIISIVMLCIYMLLQIRTLTVFPVIHSDELWLKGIANASGVAGSIWVTEPFFDLYPRAAHPFRWLYVLLQNIMIQLLGDSVISMRCLSLAAACISLICFYILLNRAKCFPVFGSMILALNIQFINSAHMGRQESLILLFMMLTTLVLQPYFIHAPENTDVHQDIFTGGILALLVFLAIGIHPNSFLIGLMVFFACLFLWRSQQRILLLLSFSAMLGSAFILLVIISNHYHPGFLTDYLNYGASLGLDAMPSNRIINYLDFYYKLLMQIGGTYDSFEIKIWLILIPVSLLFPFIRYTFSIAWINLASLILGLFLLGRNNAFSIVFMMPWVIFIILNIFKTLLNQHILNPIISHAALMILLIFTLYNLNENIRQYQQSHFYKTTYAEMLEYIDAVIPDDANVLGNLNMIEAVSETNFWDIRNLTYLPDEQGALMHYLQSHQIDYIVMHDEMAYIKKNAPRWDILYGSLDYYDTLMAILDQYATETTVVDNPIYAMRIASYSGTYPWQTTIYKIELP